MGVIRVCAWTPHIKGREVFSEVLRPSEPNPTPLAVPGSDRFPSGLVQTSLRYLTMATFDAVVTLVSVYGVVTAEGGYPVARIGAVDDVVIRCA